MNGTRFESDMSNCSGPGRSVISGSESGKNVLVDSEDLETAARILHELRFGIGRVANKAVGEQRRRDEVIRLVAEQIEMQRQELGVDQIDASLVLGQ